jgi:DNA-binding NarL/FixJ family response regulator
VSRLTQSVNQQDYLAIARAAAGSDIGSLLPKLQTPALVIHPRDFISLGVEDAMKLAGSIPKARLVLTDGATAPGDALQGLKAIDDFLGSLSSRVGSAAETSKGDGEAGLSTREVEVLRLLAAGKSNAQIADELVISLNTVRRHVSNIFAKIGVENRTEAASYAHRNSLT